MKTTKILLFLLLFLSGCATYKFQKGQPPHDKGYVVSRDSYTILEYTIGKENSVPDLESAKERFKRRRTSVEYYYKKIGSVENRFKQIFWDYPVLFAKFMGGIFRLPFIAISDYKYEHDPRYREKVRMREEKEGLSEMERINSLREELNKYIQNDLEREGYGKESTSKMPKPVEEKIEEVKSQPISPTPAEKEELSAQTKPEEEKPPKAESIEVLPQQKQKESERVAEEWLKNMEKEKEVKELSHGCQAIIIANPRKGYSPLRVKFNGLHSRSPAGKIVSYYWEFGDGDTSKLPNPTNSYWSTTYGSRYFTVTLTVEDDKGNTATASRVIEVINK